MQAIPGKTLPSPYDLLSMAWDEVVACASEVGIDAQALRHALPTPGQYLSGPSVPVLAPRYRHACRVSFHINRLPGGDTWPFLRFFTFKDGGRHCDFNGLRWWRRLGRQAAPRPTTLPVSIEQKATAQARDAATDRERQVRFLRWQMRWQGAKAPGCQHGWVQHRLQGQATPALLSRLTLRALCSGAGTPLMAPLTSSTTHESCGYQLIFPAGHAGCQEQKRLIIPTSGGSRGAFIYLKGLPEGDHLPVALCEGLATGLSLAVGWPGEIRVALNAQNLAAVRAGIHTRVVMFHDDDRWKPQAGNVGYRAATAAMKAGDSCQGPLFSSRALSAKPTDFNDLLCLDGITALREQLDAVQRHVEGW